MTDENTPLKKKRIYGPDVSLIRRESGDLVEKTYRARPMPIRIIGRLLVWWEASIYARLHGIRGIPECVPGPDPYTLVTTFMGGHNLKTRARIPDSVYFERLEALIEEMHGRGVIHLDMRNRRNYGMDDAGLPYLVDFASSLHLPFRGPLWRLLCALDRMGYLKVKAKLNPGLLSSEEHRGFAMGKFLSRLWIPSKILPIFKRLVRRSPR